MWGHEPAAMFSFSGTSFSAALFNKRSSTRHASVRAHRRDEREIKCWLLHGSPTDLLQIIMI
jgi:hypothetical protein